MKGCTKRQRQHHLVHLIRVSDEEPLPAGGERHGNHDGVTGVDHGVARAGPQGLCGDGGTKQNTRTQNTPTAPITLRVADPSSLSGSALCLIRSPVLSDQRHVCCRIRPFEKQTVIESDGKRAKGFFVCLRVLCCFAVTADTYAAGGAPAETDDAVQSEHGVRGRRQRLYG